jgi:hypothetical protein
MPSTAVTGNRTQHHREFPTESLPDSVAKHHSRSGDRIATCCSRNGAICELDFRGAFKQRQLSAPPESCFATIVSKLRRGQTTRYQAPFAAEVPRCLPQESVAMPWPRPHPQGHIAWSQRLAAAAREVIRRTFYALATLWSWVSVRSPS